MSFLDKLSAQLPFNKKEEDAEYFFALNIDLSQVTAAVWVLYGSEIDVLGQATLPYYGSDDLLEKAYHALDQSLGALEIEPHKVLFGVPDSWNVDDNLKEPYLKLLRRMLKECDLSPLAYVTTTNALAHFLHKQEGVPPTAILLGAGDDLEAALVRGGKVVEARSTKRGDVLFDDVEKVLGQLTDAEVLPSKILLYTTKENENLEKMKDNLMSYPWMQKLSFLHFPKIEILEDNVTLWSVIFAGAVELSPGIDLKHSFLSKKKHSKLSQPMVEHEPRENFGFIKGDIKDRHKDEEAEEKTPVQEELEKDQVLKKHDTEEASVPPSSEEDLKEDSLISPDLPESFKEDVPPEEEAFYTSPRMNLPQHPVKLPLEETANFNTPKVDKKVPFPLLKIIVNKLLLLPLLFVLVGGLYIFLVKASVTVFVEPGILEKEMQVVADPTISTMDEEKKIIPASVLEVTVSGSEKGTASGQKQIGDPAKGKVFVFNLTNSRVSLPAGTVLNGNSHKFTLDSSVQIASQSSSIGADFTTVTKPGKSEAVGVTASAIGPEGNLPAGIDLTVSGYTKSQVVARVEEALSGGTSKNVTIVTSDDQKKLQANLTDNLRKSAEGDIQGKLSEGKKLVSEALSVVDGKYNFNKQVNDQAGEFSLSANIRFKGTAYSEPDLKTIVSKLVATNVPEGFEMNVADSETQADIIKVEKDGKLIFKAKFRAKLLPKLNLDDLKKAMRGKSVGQVAEYLRGLENVVGSEIKLSPNLPSPLTRLPLWEKNIQISISPK